ncbi:MAG: type III pantothenate kinase, partial [Coriobacteriia bacterium]
MIPSASIGPADAVAGSSRSPGGRKEGVVMILAVDIGNTQTVLGLIGDEGPVARWRVSTEPTLTADEIRLRIGGLFTMDGRRWDEVERVV